MGVYIKQTRKKDRDSGFRRFLVEDSLGYSSEAADVVCIDLPDIYGGGSLMFEILDNGLIHIWSHKYELELIKPIWATAIIKLNPKHNKPRHL